MAMDDPVGAVLGEEGVAVVLASLVAVVAVVIRVAVIGPAWAESSPLRISI